MSKKFDFEKSFKTVLRPLELYGFWSTNPKKGPNTFFCTAWVIFINMLIVPELIDVFLVRNDAKALTFSVPPLLTGMFDDVKLYYFVKNRSRIALLIEKTRTRSFQPKTDHQEEDLKVMFEKFYILSVLFRSCALACLVTFCVSPLFSNEGLRQRRLPFAAWYPYDHTKTPWYILTYVQQVVAQCVGVDIHLGVDLLNFLLMAIIVAEFDMLGDDLRNLFQKEDCEMDENDLISCIEQHKDIVEFSQEVHKMLSFGVFAQLMLTMGCLCQQLFQLSVLDVDMQFVTVLVYIFAALFQIFLYCWWGTAVMSKSQDLPYAMFESNWVDVSTVSQKNLHFFIHRTQTPVVMCAADFFMVNLQTFMNIVRLSYSYFTVIRQANST